MRDGDNGLFERGVEMSEVKRYDRITELEQQKMELIEISLMLKNRCLSLLNNKPIRDLDEIICRLEKFTP